MKRILFTVLALLSLFVFQAKADKLIVNTGYYNGKKITLIRRYSTEINEVQAIFKVGEQIVFTKKYTFQTLNQLVGDVSTCNGFPFSNVPKMLTKMKVESNN